MQEMEKINCTPRHGGDIYNRKVVYDFSVNVNPLGIPQVVEQAFKDTVWKNMSYPQYGNSALREEIAAELKDSTENILCGNGASELFAAVVHALKP